MTQSEAQLEEQLITQLTTIGYQRVTIPDTAALRANLKTQLETHNKLQFSDHEFAQILNHLEKGNIFAKAATLRDRYQLTRDDGTARYIQFLNTEHWCQNQYQVTHQITVKGARTNRYDVTLLINGLPLVQIELKKRGGELKEAFNQIKRYYQESYKSEHLFQYVQIFVISNGVNTKYFSNNMLQSAKQTFYWADKENNLITQLQPFAEQFLEKCHLSKMISKYIVLHKTHKIMMVLRPYQYYAVEAIIDRVKETDKHGYIWHTTGSGKTLTSFKAAQILNQLPVELVHKVLFVVDRADLDYQTTREFNSFSEGSVDSTDSTKTLVRQLAETNGENRLIVTTIQKLNTAVSKNRYEKSLAPLRDKPVVLIFDECHRSQFGDTHKRISEFFNRAQMFGFTGTPIFKENATFNMHGKRTTADLFDKRLHEYVITNAIADENVLKFSIEYWGKLKRKDGSLIDEQVAAINTKEFFENPERISGVVDWIIQHHDEKTRDRQFSAMMCVSSVDALRIYYDTFQRKKTAGEHDLRVVTIFTPGDNNPDKDSDDSLPAPNFDINTSTKKNKHHREFLDKCVDDYNDMYNTAESTKDSRGFYTYYKNIAKRVKEQERSGFLKQDQVDIVLVVNMFLTGFDAKKLNTLYVDKNLRYHGLIQAFSRTNRTFGTTKPHGNIVCFRNLKPQTDQAIALFSDTNAAETIFVEPYETYVARYNDATADLQDIAPTIDSVNQLIDEDDQLRFVQTFRQLMRTLNIMRSFTEFSWDHLGITEQQFEDYKSKYLDIYDRTKSGRGDDDAVSIVNDVDFELELIQRDEINVHYILGLLNKLRTDDSPESSEEEKAQRKKAILDLLGKETQLRSKRTLIERFINSYMPTLTPDDDLDDSFRAYWSDERAAAVSQLSAEEGLDSGAVQQMIQEFHFSGKEPLRETVFAALGRRPKLMERKTLYGRIIDKLKDLIHTFDDNMGEV